MGVGPSKPRPEARRIEVIHVRWLARPGHDPDPDDLGSIITRYVDSYFDLEGNLLAEADFVDELNRRLP